MTKSNQNKLKFIVVLYFVVLVVMPPLVGFEILWVVLGFITGIAVMNKDYLLLKEVWRKFDGS